MARIPHEAAGVIAAEAQLKALMLASLAGDAAAYRALLKALGAYLRAYYARRLGGADGEDLVQETLLAMHARRATYDTSQPLTAWVYAIARYKLIDYFRRAKLRQTVPIENAEHVLAANGTDAAIIQRDVEQALASLPERTRNLIRQTKIEGLTAAEAGAVTGMSETAVKVSVHRAMKSLNEKFAERDDNEHG
jgi:RNA polymerase sigma factor (sigma-70 family)